MSIVAIANGKIDLLNPNFQNVARNGSIDEDRPCEDVGARPAILDLTIVVRTYSGTTVGDTAPD